MRLEQILISLIGLILGFALLGLGGYLFFTPYINSIQQSIQALLSQKHSLSLVGVGLMLTGCLLLTLFFFLSRRRYILIQMGGTSVQDRVIAHFARKCLQSLFPSQKVACDVVIHRKGKIEILAAIPPIAEGEEERTFNDIEAALSVVLAENCGIKAPFLLNLSYN